MESIEYKTIPRVEDVARTLEQLNELGAQGWELCGQANARSEVVGRVTPWHEVLLLKRHKEA
jgi:hypothetical protein